MLAVEARVTQLEQALREHISDQEKTERLTREFRASAQALYLARINVMERRIASQREAMEEHFATIRAMGYTWRDDPR